MSLVSGFSERILSSGTIPYIPVVDGRKPVIKEALDGPHKGAWQCASVKETPMAANRSMFGVFAGPSKLPNMVFRSSTAMKRTFGGGFADFSFSWPCSLQPKERMAIHTNKRSALNFITFLLTQNYFTQEASIFCFSVSTISGYSSEISFCS